MALEIPSPIQVGVIGTAGIDVATDGIITAQMLDEFVILGMTYGALVKLLLGISVTIIILMNIPKLITRWRNLYRGE